MGVLGYASTQRTIPKRKRQFSSRLHIPESFFDEFLSTQLDALKKCREEFRDCYGDELIEKFKQNGYAAMEASVYKGYKRDKIEMRGDRAEMSDFPLYLNTVAGGLDRRDQTIGGFSFVVKIYAVPVVEIIG